MRLLTDEELTEVFGGQASIVLFKGNPAGVHSRNGIFDTVDPGTTIILQNPAGT
jgi:hypothetical protein